MIWYAVMRKNKYMSVRRRVKNKPSEDGDNTHQEVYLGKHVVGDNDLPPDVIVTAMNIYYADIDKPNKMDVVDTLERIKSKRTGRKAVRITVNQLHNVNLKKYKD
jgi:hypothetical protein